MRHTKSADGVRHTSSLHSSYNLALALIALTFTTPLAALAQTPQKPRPVARLVSTSRQVTPEPRSTRARLVTSVPLSTSRSVATASPSNNATGGSAVAAASSLERRAFDLVNSERLGRGETPLVWDAELARMARQHSANMALTGTLDHTGPDGRDMADRARAFGIRGWRALGENIALNQGYNDPSAFAVERWMRSSKHRANILNSQFTRTAIGVARAADGSIFFTQVFAS